LLQQRGDGRDVVRKRGGAVVVDAVLGRLEAGEDGRVCGKGQRRGGDGFGVADRVAREFGEVGSVGTESVGAGGVEGDEDDVGRVNGQREEEKCERASARGGRDAAGPAGGTPAFLERCGRTRDR
jgi:hypothetical protein